MLQTNDAAAVIRRKSDLEGHAEQSLAKKGFAIMFSGCRDDQTSSDVKNATTAGAGGACTTALLKALSEGDEHTYIKLLTRMTEILMWQGHPQRPKLSTNVQFDLTKYTFQLPANNRPYRALLIGINYVGTENELQGCHNDVMQMTRFFAAKGYNEAFMKLLLDDGKHEPPTLANIVNGMSWLVQDAKQGDTLLFHYSGHGTSIADQDGDEDDGLDEALVPMDYARAGLLRDDDIYKILIQRLPEGVKLVCICDCCHSGTIMDLPYIFSVDEAEVKSKVQLKKFGRPILIGVLGVGTVLLMRTGLGRFVLAVGAVGILGVAVGRQV